MAKRVKATKTGPAERRAGRASADSVTHDRPAPRGAAITGLAVALIIAAGLFTYRNSFAGVFVLDDGPAIVLNPHIKSLWPLSRAMSAPPEVTVAGRPIVSLSLALNYSMASPDVRDVLEAPGPGASAELVERHARNLWGYHALNLAIHLAAALVLFGVVRRTIAAIGGPNGRPLQLHLSATPVALAIALIWCVHPLQTGSVTYIVQRAESLMGLFYLLTIYCAIRAHERERRALWIGASVLACDLGMGSKEVMVTAPVMVWLWDRTFAAARTGGGGDDARSARDRRWLYAGFAATWLILAWLMLTNPRPQSVGFGSADWTWWSYLVTQAGVVVHYLRLAFVPSPLVLDYGWPQAEGLIQVLPQIGLLILLFALSAWALWKRHPAGFIGAWFFVILAPTSSVVPIFTEVAAEHRMYLPLAAVVASVVIGVVAVLSRVGAGARRAIGAALTTAVVIVFSVMTDARNADYTSDERIWLDTITKRPGNARARNNYAADLLLRNDPSGAVPHLRQAVAIDPAFASAQGNLGVALCRTGRCEEGVGHLQRALTIDPAATRAHRDLAEAYASLGRNREAATHFLKALERAPDDVFLLNRAGWILATAPEADVRDGRRALTLAERAVQVTARRDEISLDTLAAALAELGRFADAATAGADALAIARQRGNTQIIPELEQRLALYRSRSGAGR